MAEFVTRHSIKGEEISDLYRKHAARYEGSLGRITDARELLSGRKRAPLPEVVAKRPDGEAFRVDTAQKYTSVQQLVNKLADPEPIQVRAKTGSSDLSDRTSSRIEKFINPATREVLSNRDLVELLLLESEAAALVIPEAARWQKVAGSYYEDDGETIRADYRVDGSGKRYHDVMDEAEDAEDKEQREAEFKPDEKRSRAAYDRHIRNLRARHYPFDLELLSRQQMVPLNPRIKGAHVTVDGLLIRTRMAPSEAIKRKYIIPGLTAHMEPKSSDEGDLTTGDLWLDQYVGADMDDDGELYPYFAYSLAGKPTQINRTGFESDAVIDLRKQCGLKSLPVAYGYGWRWFSVDPDQRAMPYTFPFGRSWMAADAALTGKAFAAWQEGFLAWFLKMPVEFLSNAALQQAWLEFVERNPLVIEAFKVLPVIGEVLPAVHPGTGRDINELIMALQGSNQQEVVNPLARGGGDAASAIERSVVSADTVMGVSDVRKTTLAMTARVGELILETCVGVSHLHGHDVLIYGNPERPTDRGDGNQSPTRAIIELKPHWLGPKDQESFDLVAEYPEQLGDKLAEKAQLFGFYEKNAITFEDWCKAIGVQDPDRYRAQLVYDAWLKTPEGVAVVMKDAAAYTGDQELVDMFKAQETGAAGPNGEPMGMLAGVNPPQGPLALPGGGLPPDAQAAVGMQDPAMSQMAAIAGAARNADAGGVGPTPAVVGV